MTYFITGNAGKFAEAKAIVPELEQLNIDLPEIQETDPQAVIEAKLKAAQEHHNGQLVVEDTSLYLDALGGLPGPLIKWFLKHIGNDGLREICRLKGNFKATAKTVVGFAVSKSDHRFYEGVIEVTIVEPRGSGFGWDPIVQPVGSSQTFGEMGTEAKNKISMRRKAFEKLATDLSK